MWQDSLRDPLLHLSLAPFVTTVIVLVVGILAQILGYRLGVPSIIFLLLGGMLFGKSGLGLVRPDVYGRGLESIIALCVALIVFEGALLIDVNHLKAASRPVIGLITVGILFTSVATCLITWRLMGLPLRVSLLFGALVSVTGPTVITPILARVSLSPHLRATLEGESIFADAVGVMLAAAIFSFIATPHLDVLSGLGNLAKSVTLGALIGVCLPLLGYVFLRRLAPLPGPLVRLAIVSIALIAYTAAELVAHETGILAVAIAGILFGSLPIPYSDSIKQLERDLTVLALSLVFVLLAANLPVHNVFGLGWQGVLLVFLMMAVVRPLCVVLSTWKSSLTSREKIFLSLLAPRGIVAASAATFFAFDLQARGIRGGDVLAQLVFLVVLVTVVVEGVGAPYLASWLEIIPPKTFILGGDKHARRLAERLVQDGEAVQLFDENLDNIHDLLGRDLPAQLCSLDDCRHFARMGARRAKSLVVATGDDERNYGLAEQLRRRFPKSRLFVRLNDEANRERMRSLGVEFWPLTEDKPKALPLSVWSAAIQPEVAREAQVRNPSFVERPLSELEIPAGSLFIVVKRDGRTFVPRGHTRLRYGDWVTIVGDPVGVEQARLALEQRGLSASSFASRLRSARRPRQD